MGRNARKPLFFTSIACLIFCLSGSVRAQVPVPWELVPSPPGGLILRVQEHPSGTLFAVTHTALFQSDDGGVTWQRNGLDLRAQGWNYPALHILPDSSLVVLSRDLVALSENRGVSWNTWQLLTPLSPYFSCVTDTGLLFSLQADGTPVRSSDRGRSWTGVQVGTASVSGFVALETGPVVAWNGQELSRSTDGGATWEPLQTCISSIRIHQVLAGPRGTIVVSYQNMFEHRFGICHSEDAGETWEYHGDGLAEYPGGYVRMGASQRDRLYFVSSSDSAVYDSHVTGSRWTRAGTLPFGAVESVQGFDFSTVFLAGYAGIYRSSNSGRTWTESNDGIDAFCARGLRYFDGNTIFAWEQHSALMRSRDGGAHWDRVFEFIPLTRTDVAIIDAHTAYVLQDTSLYRTTDAGENWTPLPLPESAFSINGIIGTPDGTVYLTPHMQISTDGGNTWTTPDNGLRVYEIFPRGNVLYMVDESKRILRSDDHAATWTETGGVVPMRPHGLWVLENGLLFMVTGSIIQRSTDGGQTWEESMDGIDPRGGIRTLEYGSNGYVYMIVTQGMESKLYLSKNRGASWQRLDEDIPSDMVTMSMNASGDLLVSSDDGLYLLRDGTLRGGQPPVARLLAVNVYPQPAADVCRVAVTLPSATSIRLQLHDAAGRLLRDLPAAWRPAGTHEQVLSLNGLAAGSYLLRVSTGGGSVTRTLTVVR